MISSGYPMKTKTTGIDRLTELNCQYTSYDIAIKVYRDAGFSDKNHRSGHCEEYPMKIQPTIPPVAAPMTISHLWHGLAGILSSKPYLSILEREISEYFGVKYVFFISSGKAALFLILQALKSLSSKQQVVIPAYTCFSVPSAIVKAGLKVSLCDINPETFDFDADLLKKTINQDTLCVIPNHLFGIPSDMDRIKQLCKDQGVFIVEDAAQAMGGKYNGRILGTIGDVGFFSLGRGKNITCGSGGILVTNSRKVAETIEKQYATLATPNSIKTIVEFFRMVILTIFIHPSRYWLPSGLPFLKLGQTTFYKDFPVAKLSGMKAGLLYRWRERLERSNRIRSETTTFYRERLWFESNSRPTIPYLRMPIIVRNREIRNSIYSRSCEQGLGISPMYPTPINKIEELESEFNGRRFPVAEKIAEQLLTIPTHHLVSENYKKRICDLFNEMLQEPLTDNTTAGGVT